MKVKAASGPIGVVNALEYEGFDVAIRDVNGSRFLYVQTESASKVEKVLQDHGERFWAVQVTETGYFFRVYRSKARLDWLITILSKEDPQGNAKV